MGGSGSGVPVELDGGSGTAGSHWDEETFGNELMTGYINAGENYISGMSAAAFKDMGYVVTPDYLAWADARIRVRLAFARLGRPETKRACREGTPLLFDPRSDREAKAQIRTALNSKPLIEIAAMDEMTRLTT